MSTKGVIIELNDFLWENETDVILKIMLFECLR